MKLPILPVLIVLGISLWVLLYQVFCLFRKEKYTSRIKLYTGQLETAGRDEK